MFNWQWFKNVYTSYDEVSILHGNVKFCSFHFYSQGSPMGWKYIYQDLVSIRLGNVITWTNVGLGNRSKWNLFENHNFSSRVLTQCLTHWGQVMHICVSKLSIIGSDNGLSPGRRQAIIWTNAGILLIRTLRTNFSKIFSEIHAFSFKKMHLQMSSVRNGVHFVSASMC